METPGIDDAMVAIIAELLLRRLRATDGNWTLTLEATDGHLRKYLLTESGGRDSFSRFDDPAGRTLD